MQSTNGTDRAKQAGIEAAKAKGIYKGRKLSVPVTVSGVVPVPFRPPGVRRKPTREPACRLRGPGRASGAGQPLKGFQAQVA